MDAIFLIPVTVMIIEGVFSGLWVPLYFRNGIAVFSKTFPFNEVPLISPDDLYSELHHYIIPIDFVRISDHEIAFRETVNTIIIQSFFVMRGIIKKNEKIKKLLLLDMSIGAGFVSSFFSFYIFY